MSLERLFASLPDFASFEVDPTGCVLQWPESARRLFGYSAEEMIGRQASLLHETRSDADGSDDGPIRFERMERFVWVIKKCGEPFWANEITVPIEGATPGETRLKRLVRDLTAWKAMLDDRDRVFNFSVDLICVTDADAVFRRINPAFTRILGYPESYILGKSFRDFIHPDDLAMTRAEAQAIVVGQTDPERLFRNRYRCADGTYRSLEWQSILDPATGMIYAVARDITIQQVRDKKMQEYARELERSNNELQQFAYVASHDLQEPLRAVAGCVQMLGDRQAGRLDEKSQELMDHAIEGAKRMQALISDLLAFSRVGSKGVNKQRICSHTCVLNATKQLRAAIEESGAVIGSDALPEIWADRVQMTQLFQNLIGNAIKFRSEQRIEIRISAQVGQGETLFSVRDNGIGIEAEYRDRVFGLFQRLHSRHAYAGTGIGLAICKKIVERHDGRIWIEPSDSGTDFRFSISDQEPE
ncbi:MAG TPA: ATP-binding protein [Tepidisphaeraceae bacterium]|jgi:PAS domain S-box-containing protein